jgi:hypothetical protein
VVGAEPGDLVGIEPLDLSALQPRLAHYLGFPDRSGGITTVVALLEKGSGEHDSEGERSRVNSHAIATRHETATPISPNLARELHAWR